MRQRHEKWQLTENPSCSTLNRPTHAGKYLAPRYGHDALISGLHGLLWWPLSPLCSLCFTLIASYRGSRGQGSDHAPRPINSLVFRGNNPLRISDHGKLGDGTSGYRSNQAFVSLLWIREAFEVIPTLVIFTRKTCKFDLFSESITSPQSPSVVQLRLHYLSSP